LEIACTRCERVGSYGLAGLIAQHGREKRLLDLRYAIAADCPLMMERRTDRFCGVFYPGLAELVGRE
jgi:hypothetical protein